MQLIDKHVPITGGSAGLGLALARALIDAGVRVTICGRSRPRLEAAVRSHGPLDVLVNNAGSQQLMDFSRDGQQRPIAEELQFNLTAPCAGSSPVLAWGWWR